MKLLRRPSESDLANTYLELRAIENTLRKQYEKSKKRKDIEHEVELCRLIVENGSKQLETVMEIVGRYSPQTKRKLKSQFKSFRSRSSKDFAELSTKYENFPEEMRDEMISNFIEVKLTSLEIHEKFAHIVFLAVTDTLKVIRYPFLMRKSDVLLKALSKVDPKYAKLYKACWEAFESFNPDRNRQCAATLRELLFGILNKKGKGRDRVTKVSYILKEQEDPKFVKAFIAFVETVSKFLGKAVHKEINSKATAFTISMVEDILLFILNGNK